MKKLNTQSALLSREVEGPALRNLGNLNESVKGANSGRRVLEDERVYQNYAVALSKAEGQLSFMEVAL